jgi:superfamily II DNA or RNA helicase
MTIWDKIIKDTNTKSSEKQLKSLNDLSLILDKKGITICIYKLQDLNIYTILINKFTISIKTIMGYIQKIKSYTKNLENATITFPRFGLLSFFKKNYKNYNIIKNIGSGIAPEIKFKWTGNFKNNQLIIKDYIMKNIYNIENRRTGNCGLILNLEAGQGKSYLATGLMELIQKKTLIICHNKSILNQWVELLKIAYPDNKIGVYYGDKKMDGDIIVSIINSLLLDKFYFDITKSDITKSDITKSDITKPDKIEIPRDDFFNMFGFVILDEIHEYSGGKRKNIYKLIQSKYMLGLSATPDENAQGMDIINTWNCGEILIAENLKGYSVETINFKGNVSRINYVGNPEFTQLILNEKLGIVSCSSMISQICKDPYRLYLITKKIFDLLNKHQYIFVFTDRRDYLDKIKTHLEKNNISTHFLLSENDKCNITTLMGGSKSQEIECAKIKSDIILTTYQFMGTGISIPKMNAIVLATPRKSKSKQYINRIFRLGSNYDITREIVDIVDVSTPMKSQYYKRKIHYDGKQYPIITTKIKWDELKSEMTDKNIINEFIDGDNLETGELDNTDSIEVQLHNLKKMLS